MGFYNSWLRHEGNLSCISEAMLVAFDRAVPVDNAPVALLQLGVGNGGEMQVWRDALPDGSTVVGIDSRPECSGLGLPVLIGDINDPTWVRNVLRDQWFDVVVCMSGLPVTVWPFLRIGGVCIAVKPPLPLVKQLVDDLASERDSWLPGEEIQSVTWFPNVAVLEKRIPKVIPFMDVMTGGAAPVVPASDYIAAGGRWIAREQKTSN